MIERNRFTNVVDTLASAKASMRCQDMVTALESLGFEVRDGKKQGHKLLMHGGIPGFLSAGFTCGHGRNPEIKPVYVNNIRRLLLRYETEILRFLETRHEH